MKKLWLWDVHGVQGELEEVEGIKYQNLFMIASFWRASWVIYLTRGCEKSLSLENGVARMNRFPEESWNN